MVDYILCGICGKPTNCYENVIEFRRRCLRNMGYAAGLGVCGAALGAFALPFIGFGSAGVASGSIAAWWQSLLGGAVASGSAFAILQSLGATGVGVLIFSSITATTFAASPVYKLFSEIASSIGWCNGNHQLILATVD